MTICKLDGCTQPVHGQGWCTRHYNQWYKGHAPTLRTRQSVPADRALPYLAQLREVHDLDRLAKLLDCHRNTLKRLPYKKVMSARIAEAIMLEAGADVEDLYTDLPAAASRCAESVTWPEVAVYAKTPDGQEFIEQCRTLRAEAA